MQEAAKEMWSVRTLHRNISSQYYYRLLQSQAKDVVIDEMKQITAPMQDDKLEFIKNPVVTEFLGLAHNSKFSETELESAIITHLQKFIMELGKGYAFVARQKISEPIWATFISISCSTTTFSNALCLSI